MQFSVRSSRVIFLSACLITSLLQVIPGRLIHLDEVFFKSAGRHWAATGRFAAPEIAGHIDVHPGTEEIYAAQPPLYTFAFGLYTRIVGFGPFRCVVFDELIHVMLACITVVLARSLFEVPARLAYLVGIPVLFVGTRGRPDEMAMCLALLGLLAWKYPADPGIRAILSGIAFGLCFATSVGAGLFLFPLAILIAHQQDNFKIRTALRWVLSVLLTVAICIAPILIYHPFAYRQFLNHAAGESLQLAEILKKFSNTDASSLSSQYYGPQKSHPWKWIVNSELSGIVNLIHGGQAIVAVIAGCVLIVLICICTRPRLQSRAWKHYLSFAACGFVANWLILPGKHTYLWFFGPWLLSVCGAVLAESYAQLKRTARIGIVLTGAIATMIIVSVYVQNRAIMIALPQEQRFYRNMTYVRDLIPAGSRVATKDFWWALADKCEVVDPDYAHLGSAGVDYIVKTGNGSGAPGKPVEFDGAYEDYAKSNHFVVIIDRLNSTPLKVGALRLSHNAWGFGPQILGRPESILNKTITASQNALP